MKQKLQLSNYTMTTALGRGLAAQRHAIHHQQTGLRLCDLNDVDLQTWIGRVDGVEDVMLPPTLEDYRCRNNQLAWMGLEQDDFRQQVAEVARHYGSQRIGVFMGTSTSGIQQTEQAYGLAAPDQALGAGFNYRTTQNIFSLGDFVARALDLEGPVQVISTACSSSAKVFAAAYRHMAAGLCDAAVVGGVDSLCGMTLYGFNSLQLVSTSPCRPADVNRDGLSIGEAAGFALLEWKRPQYAGPCLLGYGESADAYHMSSPHPQGLGAAMAMGRAMAGSGLTSSEIDYVNLHGTATPVNDLSESHGLLKVFTSDPACSSTKGFTGHTLGAAGIVEAVFCCLALEEQYVPSSLNTLELDDQIRLNIVLQGRERQLKYVMSNSFGFGGSNACLIFGAT